MPDFLHTVTSLTEPNDGIGNTELWKVSQGDALPLDSGQSTFPRTDIISATALTTSGVRFTYFVSTKAIVTTQVRTLSGSTAAGATPTLAKIGLYLQNSDGSLTRVAVTANDTSLFAATATVYTSAWLSPYRMLSGQTYALGVIVVTGATAPTLLGPPGAQNAAQILEWGILPRVAANVADTDLASSYTNAQLGSSSQRHYAVILP